MKDDINTILQLPKKRLSAVRSPHSSRSAAFTTLGSSAPSLSLDCCFQPRAPRRSERIGCEK